MSPSKSDLDYAIGLVRRVCELCGEPDLIEDIRASFRDMGLLQAIRHHDSDAIFGWMVEAIAYQGVSNQAATTYMEVHGTVSAWDIGQGLVRKQLCSKLRDYWHYEGCGYRKSTASCNEQAQYHRCSLPRHDLRNGSLNQAAYSLYLFIRDVAGGDLVGWMDHRLAMADEPLSPVRPQLLRDAVVAPLLHVHGVSHKVLHMTLATLLLADGKRHRWRLAGTAMVAVDTLIHNWLWRTGIMRRLGSLHPYGLACYRDKGCAAIIEQMSRHIDARGFNLGFPTDFPRFVQKAIWTFCAAEHLNQCNGNTVDDRKRCAVSSCPLFGDCNRVRLVQI